MVLVNENRGELLTVSLKKKKKILWNPRAVAHWMPYKAPQASPRRIECCCLVLFWALTIAWTAQPPITTPRPHPGGDKEGSISVDLEDIYRRRAPSRVLLTARTSSVLGGEQLTRSHFCQLIYSESGKH